MKKLLRVSLFLTLLMMGCTADIPDSDDVLPQFELTIIGDGFSHTFDQDDDLTKLQLNLNRNAEYRFIFSGSDDGGLQLLSWSWEEFLDDHIFLRLPEIIPTGWSEGGAVFPDAGLTFNGDDEDPRRIQIISGKIKPSLYNEQRYNYFQFTALDYGGTEGYYNIAENEISILIADHPTALIRKK